MVVTPLDIQISLESLTLKKNNNNKIYLRTPMVVTPLEMLLSWEQ